MISQSFIVYYSPSFLAWLSDVRRLYLSIMMKAPTAPRRAHILFNFPLTLLLLHLLQLISQFFLSRILLRTAGINKCKCCTNRISVGLAGFGRCGRAEAGSLEIFREEGFQSGWEVFWRCEEDWALWALACFRRSLNPVAMTGAMPVGSRKRHQ